MTGKSTDSVLYHLLANIRETLDSKAIPLGTFLDIEGPFNKQTIMFACHAMVH